MEVFWYMKRLWSKKISFYEITMNLDLKNLVRRNITAFTTYYIIIAQMKNDECFVYKAKACLSNKLCNLCRRLKTLFVLLRSYWIVYNNLKVFLECYIWYKVLVESYWRLSFSFFLSFLVFQVKVTFHSLIFPWHDLWIIFCKPLFMVIHLLIFCVFWKLLM